MEIEARLREFGPQVFGVVAGADGVNLRIAGLSHRVRLGDDIGIATECGARIEAQIVAIDRNIAIASAYDSLQGAKTGDRVTLSHGNQEIYPTNAWIGRIIDAFGEPLDGIALPKGGAPFPINCAAPPAASRKLLGERNETGLCVFDTFLPICRGQRLGLFAGPGVGKSTLLGDLARGVDCDVVVAALVGERGREVRPFIKETLGENGAQKAVTIVSTADQSPLLKKRAAYFAMATAEFFRSQKLHVLLLMDSLTRFAEAHREIALTVGETPSLHAYPPSTFRTIASLVERAGPGREGEGDITSVFSVLVAGSDMNEPVADMVRGVLDGHVILSRSIAERGRYPAIDISRSLSRSLPSAATSEENKLLRDAREIFTTYEESEAMVRAGLYANGSDAAIDRAVEFWPKLDRFVASKSPGGIQSSFKQLREVLSPPASGE